jgi:hypothetical protein
LENLVNTILLRPGYGQLGLADGEVKLNIPIARPREFEIVIVN